MDITPYLSYLRLLFNRLNQLFLRSRKTFMGKTLFILANGVSTLCLVYGVTLYMLDQANRDLVARMSTGSQLAEIRIVEKVSDLLALCQLSIENGQKQSAFYCDIAEKEYRSQFNGTQEAFNDEIAPLFQNQAYPLLKIYNDNYLRLLKDKLTNRYSKNSPPELFVTFISSPLGFSVFVFIGLFAVSWPAILYLSLNKRTDLI